MNQPQEYTMFLDPATGAVEYLHVDLEGAVELGAMQVSRASEVEFDDGMGVVPHEQKDGKIVNAKWGQVREPAWVARLNDGREIARHPRRDEVLRIERKVIEAMQATGEPIPGL